MTYLLQRTLPLGLPHPSNNSTVVISSVDRATDEVTVISIQSLKATVQSFIRDTGLPFGDWAL